MDQRDKNGLTEAEFLEQYREKAHRYPRPFLTADCVILTPAEPGKWQVLLIRRGGHPFLGQLALPGGFAQADETMERSAMRELMEETGVCQPMSLLGVYSAPGRDPRGWVVSVAYLAILPQRPAVKPGDDAADALWLTAWLDAKGGLCLEAEGEQPTLAFDHAAILTHALQQAGAKRAL